MTPRHLLVICTALFAGAAGAQTFDMNLSSDSAQFKYGTLIGGSIYGRSEMGLGFLYNENGNTLSEVSLHVIDAAGSKTPGLTLGIGPKLYYATADNGDTLALGVGGRLQYKLASVNRIVGGLYGYYAPSITTFMDADSFTELGASLEYELLPSANAYLGYRTLRTHLDVRGSETVDSGFNIGMRLTF